MNEETRLHRLKHAKRELARVEKLRAAAQKEVDDLSVSFPTPNAASITCLKCGIHMIYSGISHLCLNCR